MRRVLNSPSARPFWLLAAIVLAFWLVDFGHGRFVNRATAFSVLQQFATIGPVALGLGLTMIAREFDLSVGSMMSLAGCVAVMLGAEHPLVGVLAAMLVGLASGVIQGGIMVGLRLSSVGVTLGGLLTVGGIAYVLTGNATIGYPRMDVAMLVNEPVLGIFSLRNVVAIVLFAIAAFLFFATRLGRDTTAVGSDPRAALVAGVNVDRMLIGIFALSGTLTALAGALLSYSLAAASPVALVDALVPATAAAIIGGVPPYVHDIVTGGVLLGVALLDAPELQRRLRALRRARVR